MRSIPIIDIQHHESCINNAESNLIIRPHNMAIESLKCGYDSGLDGPAAWIDGKLSRVSAITMKRMGFGFSCGYVVDND